MNLRIHHILSVFALVSAAATLTAFLQSEGLLRVVLTIPYALIIPGSLILLALKVNEIRPWEWFAYTVAASIGFLMFSGLLINTILPYLGNQRPLTLVPLWIGSLILLALIAIPAYVRNRNRIFTIATETPDAWNLTLGAIALEFTALAVYGAYTVNSGGSSAVPLLAIAMMAFFCVAAAVTHRRVQTSTYAFGAFMLALSATWMLSLRGSTVIGPDVSYEYRFFTIVLQQGIWNINQFPYAYYGCLSVTILPVMLSQFLAVSGNAVFKVVFQALFATSFVTVYLMLKRYAPPAVAFLSVVFAVGYYAASLTSAIATRQIIAFMFFAVLMFVLFDKRLGSTTKTALFLFFGAGMIVSHYSTSYIALGLLAAIFFMRLAYQHTSFRQPFEKVYLFLRLHKADANNQRVQSRPALTALMLAGILVLAVIWYGPVTGTGRNLGEFIGQSIGNVNNFRNSDTRAEGVSLLQQFNIFYKPVEGAPALSNYTSTATENYQQKEYLTLYPQSVSQQYPVTPAATEVNQLVIPPAASNVLILTENLIKKLLKVLIVIGTLFIVWTGMRDERGTLFPAEFIFLIGISLVVLLAITIVPYASIQYDFARTAEQIMPFLALSAAIGGLWVVNRLGESAAVITIGVLMGSFLFLNAGALTTLTGGTEPYLPLQNVGTAYDRFYVQPDELATIAWMTENVNSSSLIYADGDNMKKLVTFGNYSQYAIQTDVFPSTLDQRAYVFSSATNTVKLRSFVYDRNAAVPYAWPSAFLDAYKSEIYSNGMSAVYR